MAKYEQIIRSESQLILASFSLCDFLKNIGKGTQFWEKALAETVKCFLSVLTNDDYSVDRLLLNYFWSNIIDTDYLTHCERTI